MACQPCGHPHVRGGHPGPPPVTHRIGLCLLPEGRGRWQPPLLVLQPLCLQAKLLSHLAPTCLARADVTNALLSGIWEGATWGRSLAGLTLAAHHPGCSPPRLSCRAGNGLKSSNAQQGEMGEGWLDPSSCPLPNSRVSPVGWEEGN